MKLSRCVVVCTALTVSSWSGLAVATPIAFDGFESYTPATALNGGSAGTGGPGANGEFGWSENWTAVAGVNTASAAVAFGSGARSGEVAGATNDIAAATRTFAAQTGTVYFSVLFRPGAGLEASDFMHFYLANNTASNNNSGGFGKIDTASNLFGVRVGATNGGSTVNSGSAAQLGVTTLLVGKLSKTSAGNYNRIDLFVDPAGNVEPGVGSATASGDTGIATVSNFGFRTFNFDAGDQYLFDTVRIGTTFADVVPEPASLGLLGIGAIGLLRRRRA